MNDDSKCKKYIYECKKMGINILENSDNKNSLDNSYEYTIKEDERRMRHTELRLLQEQINPHFLYNALDTIVWLIESKENNKTLLEDIFLSQNRFFCRMKDN